MPALIRSIARVANAIRKISAGLELFGESVWPGFNNDLFVAHSSIYHFFANFTNGKRVLDAGCGTGYGTYFLAVNGATRIIGVDIDKRSIRFARRRYLASNLSFSVADCHCLDLDESVFDVVVASNMLEHLRDPILFLDKIRRFLSESGQLIIALPPIFSEHDLSHNEERHYHRSNLSIDQWMQLFKIAGWSISAYRHIYVGSEELDFTSPLPSKARLEDFVFNPANRNEIYSSPCLTVVYVLNPSEVRARR